MSARSSETSIILAVTFGSILEWYEIGLYIYWAQIIEKVVFDFALPVIEAVNTFMVFLVGFFARPLGGLIFGYFGDRWGRKTSFTLSVIFASIPSFLVGLMPSYSGWSLFSLVFFSVMKFLQGFPAGGEVPGAICYLSENTTPERKKYVCSYALVGPQIGLLFSLVECLLLKKYLSYEDLSQWGWRISFLICGLLGVIGYFLRKRLHESLLFEHLKSEHKLLKKPIREAFTTYGSRIFLGFVVSIFEVVAFCTLTIVPSEYFKELFNLNDNLNLTINCILLTICAIAPPIIGKIADTYKNIPLLKISAVVCVLLSYPFYLAVSKISLVFTLIIQIILILFFSIQVALLPSLLSDLFPTSIRYTGVGFSFNVCDGVLWGITPILSFLLIQSTNQPASFIILLPLAAIIFLTSFYYIKKIKTNFKTSIG